MGGMRVLFIEFGEGDASEEVSSLWSGVSRVEFAREELTCSVWFGEEDAEDVSRIELQIGDNDEFEDLVQAITNNARDGIVHIVKQKKKKKKKKETKNKKRKQKKEKKSKEKQTTKKEKLKNSEASTKDETAASTPK